VRTDLRRHLTVLTLVVAAIAHARAADRADIGFADGRIFPESVTSTRDGTVYAGSLGLDSVYRATPTSTRAEAWIPAKSNGLQTVLGVFADEAAGTLWVCTSAGGGRGGAPLVGETAVKAFNLADASFKGSYPFPGSGFCNDFAVATEGTLYVADTGSGRILRLKKGATALDVWASNNPLLASADGLALLADGALYVNSFGQGTLARIAVKGDGSAGPITRLETSRPLAQPDGMRTVGPNTLLMIEGAGRLDEVTITGDRAEIKTLREGLAGPTAVTRTGGMAYVAEGRLNLRDSTTDPGPFRIVGVPYPAAR
jgi:sugar lactone lactonase YvrE